MRRTSHTAEASTVHEPFGKPSGPGLFHHKGLQLPAYIQHVAHELVAQGHDESRAIEMAVGIVRNWAEGHDGHGNRVSADVQAAASKAIAEWEADKAKAGNGKARRSAVADNKPYGDVKYADPKNGKYPLDTEEHIRAAWSYINMPKNASQYPMNGVTLSEVKARIKAAMKGIGADVADDDSGGGASRAEYMRMYPLEDMHIIRSADGGDGRTVEAFAAVFDDPAEIHDHEGHYIEVIDRAAFNRAIEHASRARGGFPGAVKVLYNHGMTIQGTPSERFSMPIGTPVEIRAEARGLLTRTRYSETPLADEVLESIRSGSITSQSFTGRIMRSDPQLRRGDRHRPGSDGQLRTVRRTELGLREYGPVLWPAYSGAEILGVRMSTPGAFLDPDGTDEALPPDEGPAAGDPLATDEHSARYHQHALYRLRSQELRESKGLAW